jgi:hypothetical protein
MTIARWGTNKDLNPMKKIKNLLAIAGATAAMVSSASALTIDFGTQTRALSDSLSFTVGGYTATVSAVTTDELGNVTGAAKIAQFGLTGNNQGGLGVTNSSGDAHTIDGSGALDTNDLLIITFDKPVTLTAASFGNVDSNDDGTIWADGAKLGTYALAGYPSLLPLNALGTVFGFGATGKDDDFKLRSINFDAGIVSAIPLPPAALLLASGLFGAGFIARRKKA